MRLIENLANITGNASYAQQLVKLYESLKSQFFDAFWNETQNHYVNGTQTSYALALKAGLYPNETILNILQQGLLKQIKADGTKLTTGIIGTKWLFPILSEMLNETELALYLIKGGSDNDNASYPSYRFMFNNSIEPALTTWELWNAALTTGDYPDNLPHMDSRNQQMFTTVSGYLSEYISGLKQGDTYNKFILEIGHLSKDILEWSSFKNIEGLSYDWQWENYDKLKVNITIPVGYTVDIRMRLQERNNNNCEWVTYDGYDDDVSADLMVINSELGSGRYCYTIACI